tara:strand:+ start:4686 stop:5933 length:1248 start_codon:yes stop_codon:yes gene_type:complete
MIDIKKLRDNIQNAQEVLFTRGYDLDVQKFEELDKNRKNLQIESEDLQSKRKTLSNEFGKLKSTGQSTDDLKSKIDSINDDLKTKSNELTKILNALREFQLDIPNIPHESVPHGTDEAENIVIEKYGEIISSNTLDHLEITNDIDTELAAKIAGTRFSVLRGEIAKLQRCLTLFMIDTAIKNGYEEYYLPYMANIESLTGTGQLPKFEEDLFKSSDSLYMIPTAEVPLTNLFRDEVLNKSELPKKVTSHTPCFRSEAGSYGKDTKGLIRQHQFEKVELVQIVDPEKSVDALNELLSHAMEILDLLELPYQVIELCRGDLGFSSSKTFDIEVWMPSQNKYREISSCSNFSDFQARRSNIKFKSNNSNDYVHTINGSGLAVGRTLIALIENNYDADSKTIKIPNILLEYFGKDTIVV